MERLSIHIPEKDHHVPSQQGLRDEILTTVSAGDDTTSIANRVTRLRIVNNPQIHGRLLAELRTVRPRPDTKPPSLELEQLHQGRSPLSLQKSPQFRSRSFHETSPDINPAKFIVAFSHGTRHQISVFPGTPFRHNSITALSPR